MWNPVEVGVAQRHDPGGLTSGAVLRTALAVAVITWALLWLLVSATSCSEKHRNPVHPGAPLAVPADTCDDDDIRSPVWSGAALSDTLLVWPEEEP